MVRAIVSQLLVSQFPLLPPVETKAFGRVARSVPGTKIPARNRPSGRQR